MTDISDCKPGQAWATIEPQIQYRRLHNGEQHYRVRYRGGCFSARHIWHARQVLNALKFWLPTEFMELAKQMLNSNVDYYYDQSEALRKIIGIDRLERNYEDMRKAYINEREGLRALGAEYEDLRKAYNKLKGECTKGGVA